MPGLVTISWPSQPPTETSATSISDINCAAGAGCHLAVSEEQSPIINQVSTPSCLEVLPTELLLEIISFLPTLEGLTNLIRCNKLLRHRLEPMLYSSQVDRDTALSWACITGNLAMIRRVVSYGASPSRLSHQDGDLTLCLAIKHNQIEVFKLLLELGASLCGTGISRQAESIHVKQAMKRLQSSKRLPLLRAFLEAGLDLQARSIHSPEVAFPLIRPIASGAADPDLVRSPPRPQREPESCLIAMEARVRHAFVRGNSARIARDCPATAGTGRENPRPGSSLSDMETVAYPGVCGGLRHV
ncbi:hypothetical protein B0H66DRAFT_631916 [Apodospora peruviana]|uniref:F-box domain-containing protein n=1 Tax=Apodospora peruviana TaxID=516989 RepID=A0AAE0HU93_9PEZI|nr:hypothetical protein B0H66DRAFT_631916 [Apodospora peruviana]